MTLSSIVADIKAALGNITGLKVLDHAAESISQVPAVIIAHDRPVIVWDEALAGTTHRIRLRVVVLVRSGDVAGAWDDLENLLAPTTADHATSIRGAINAHVISGTVRVTEAEAVGRILWAGAPYWGCILRVEVLDG